MYNTVAETSLILLCKIYINSLGKKKHVIALNSLQKHKNITVILKKQCQNIIFSKEGCD